MSTLDKQAIRRKIMGTLLRHARVTAGRSQAELAAALHVSKYRFAQYERGDGEISLPELERVAELCGVALGYFFDDEAQVEDEALEIRHETAPRIKRKTLGALVRLARDRANRTQKDCASLLDVSSRRFSQYERGEVEISPSELETLASYLGVSLDHFSF
jgi:transcriptional regulator with XRE-family HTH domain